VIVIDVVAVVFIVIGALSLLVSGIGVVKLPDVYPRMHAAAQAPTLGVLGTAVGVALAVRTWPTTITVLLVVVLLLGTGPVGSHLLGRAVYRTRRHEPLIVDELGDDDRRAN
jgi:multicomponent Na+:H+ antiporter subunit G